MITSDAGKKICCDYCKGAYKLILLPTLILFCELENYWFHFQGCYMGKYRESDSEWIDESDPCKIYKCHNGQIKGSIINRSTCDDPKLALSNVTAKCCAAYSGKNSTDLGQSSESFFINLSPDLIQM